MRQKVHVFQCLVAFFVIFSACAFFWFLYVFAIPSGGDVRVFRASFESVGQSLNKGSAVKINGVVVGHVSEIRLNPETFFAEVTFNLDRNIPLYDDVRAFIEQPLMGDSSLCLSPGVSGEALSPKDVILNTDAPQGLWDFIGQYLFRSKSSSRPSGEKDG